MYETNQIREAGISFWGLLKTVFTLELVIEQSLIDDESAVWLMSVLLVRSGLKVSTSSTVPILKSVL